MAIAQLLSQDPGFSLLLAHVFTVQKWWLVFVPVEGTIEFSEGHKPWDSYSPFKQNRDFMI